ncbi:hypothetical protein ABTX77_39015 [Streptomyces sp. NPDC097704]|uniref:hypothetical protein n=1 Tax=Streptomyces sp. NPDC097704 TaxID=3157101 RepID=UPI00331A2906
MPSEAEPVQARPQSEDEGVGLREAQHELFGVTLAGLRWARASDPEFPGSVGKRGTEFLYRLSELRHWARNRPAPRGDVCRGVPRS